MLDQNDDDEDDEDDEDDVLISVSVCLRESRPIAHLAMDASDSICNIAISITVNWHDQA